MSVCVIDETLNFTTTSEAMEKIMEKNFGNFVVIMTWLVYQMSIKICIQKMNFVLLDNCHTENVCKPECRG